MKLTPAQKQTRALVLAAAAACEDKKGQHTVILALDPSDSALSDYFLLTSAANNRQVTAIADEIELRLKRQFGLYPQSVEGRRNGEWILLDYVDFVVHVFLAERRAFYHIERLRQLARLFTPAEFDAAWKPARKSAAKPATKAAAKSKAKAGIAKAKAPAKARAALAKSAAKTVAKTKTKKPAVRAAAAPKKAAAKKAAAKSAPRRSKTAAAGKPAARPAVKKKSSRR